MLALVLMTSRVSGQPSADARQLATVLRQEFGVPVSVVEGPRDNLFIYVSAPPVDTLKYTTTDQEQYAQRVALFAHDHSALAHRSRVIHVQLFMRLDFGVQGKVKSLGTWMWDNHSLEDSSAPPDLLKGSRPK